MTATRALPLSRLDHLTYRGNSKQTRYGWLRLTPAFSVHLILDLIRSLPSDARVLDPFCGTGTTALVCAEEGIEAATTDINPFLLWLGAAKCSQYSVQD
ncbi:MAG: DNA methyltransferase, partial [Terriglobales bacterium]